MTKAENNSQFFRETVPKFSRSNTLYKIVPREVLSSSIKLAFEQMTFVRRLGELQTNRYTFIEVWNDFRDSLLQWRRKVNNMRWRQTRFANRIQWKSREAEQNFSEYDEVTESPDCVRGNDFLGCYDIERNSLRVWFQTYIYIYQLSETFSIWILVFLLHLNKRFPAASCRRG